MRNDMADNVIKINKKTSKENLTSRINSNTAKIRELSKLNANETIDQIRDIRQKEIDNLILQKEEWQLELDDIVEQKKTSAKASLGEVITDNVIAYIASDDKYIMIRNYSETEKRVNLDIRTLTKIEIQGVLNKLSGIAGRFDDLAPIEIRQCFESVGRSFLIKTSSFDAVKWRSNEVYNTILEQRKFWAPIDRGCDYDPCFDELMYSLGGGKQENIEHIEKWVAFKYLYPEKCKTMPGLNITGKPGGNGKGMFTDMLRSIFTGQGVSLVRAKNLTGGFNAIMEGKVVTILDDEDKSKFPNSELKQAQGNSSAIIEPKGVDAYSIDNTSTMVVLDNTGLVKLAGGGSGGEDRRWSIVLTELALLESLQQRHTMTETEAKEFADWMGEQVLNDRIACGKWVAAQIKKHNVDKMVVLPPLHGADYVSRLNEQKDNWADIFEKILPIFVNQGVMPFDFIKQIVEIETDQKIIQLRTLSMRFDEFLSRKGLKNIEKHTDFTTTISFGKMFQVEKLKSAVRRLEGSTANKFDYGLISTEPFNKKKKLTVDTLELHDFATKTSEIQDRIFTPATPATPLTEDDYE
jgi:hypothetical protein